MSAGLLISHLPLPLSPSSFFPASRCLISMKMTESFTRENGRGWEKSKPIILFKWELGYCSLRVSRELLCLRPEREEAEASEQNILQAVNSRWAPVPLTSLTSGHSGGSDIPERPEILLGPLWSCSFLLIPFFLLTNVPQALPHLPFLISIGFQLAQPDILWTLQFRKTARSSKRGAWMKNCFMTCLQSVFLEVQRMWRGGRGIKEDEESNELSKESLGFHCVFSMTLVM